MKTIRLLSFAPALMLLCSCSDIYYAPNTPHLPMVKEKGVTELNTTIGFGNEAAYFDVNAFHSVSNHVGIMLNYSNFSNMYVEKNIQNALDVGAGYFNSLGEKGGFEIYSTIGYGSLGLTTPDYNSYQNISNGSLSTFRFSFTPDIFFSSRHFDAGFGIRMMYLSFNRELPSNEYYDYYGYSNTSLRNAVMLEPTLKLAVGGERTKFSVQGTYSGLTGKSFSYDPYNISVGVAIKIFSK